MTGTAVDPAEDHPPRRGLEHAGDGDGHFLAHVGAALLDHHHGAVLEIADPLAHLVARLDDAHVQRFSGQGDRLEGVGDLVQVDDLDPLQLGDLVQVVVIGHHPAAQAAGHDHEPLIDLEDVVQLGQVGLVDLELDLGVIQHPLEHVQAAAAPVALQLVSAVGDAL